LSLAEKTRERKKGTIGWEPDFCPENFTQGHEDTKKKLTRSGGWFAYGGYAQVAPKELEGSG
jgi:hypothetical protein